MQNDSMKRLISAWPEHFFRSLQEEVDAGFAMAYRTAVEKVEAPERRQALGQMRHFRTEASFRAAGKLAGLNVHVPDTMPKGGTYSVVESADIYMLRANVLTCKEPPRPTLFRRRWASINAYLSAVQCDLFSPRQPEPPKDRLTAFLVVTANRKGDQEVPAWVGIGIPNHDLSAWLSLSSISDILAAYSDAKKPAVEEAPVTVADRAQPKIKKRDSGPRD